MKRRCGILAYGSLISEPGVEIRSASVKCLTGFTTPFRVEYARKSRGRGGAPTLVPVRQGGAQVKAVIFVLQAGASEREATDMLWRREINQVGSGRSYVPVAKPGPNNVIVKRLENFRGVGVVLYTEIAENIEPLTARKLAELALESAKSKHGAEGRDGISYLITAKRNGIVTPLSPEYEKEVLRRTGSPNLEEALRVVRE